MLDKLVANAVEFAAGGAIDIRLESADAEVRLAVANDGPPLPEGMAGRVFDSMVSVRAGGETSAPHLGLGLYIVRVIAQFHGGRAEAANKPDGSGVVVVVTLPPASA
jgi:two-component system sensor histidine kinase ChvG